jgi:hypothetical protein
MDSIDQGVVPHSRLIQFVIRITKEFFPKKMDDVKDVLLENFLKEPHLSSEVDNSRFGAEYKDIDCMEEDGELAVKNEH